MEMAKIHNCYPDVFQSVRYTKSELEKVEYFSMSIMTPLELEGTNAAEYGTQYEGGCHNPICRLGKKLVGDVLVDRKLMKKWDIGTLKPDIYVTEKLRDIILENSFTGISFVG